MLGIARKKLIEKIDDDFGCGFVAAMAAVILFPVVLATSSGVNSVIRSWLILMSQRPNANPYLETLRWYDGVVVACWATLGGIALTVNLFLLIVGLLRKL